jgi:hypothetical protein
MNSAPRTWTIWGTFIWLSLLGLTSYGQDPVGKISMIKPKTGYGLRILRNGTPLPQVEVNTPVRVGDQVTTNADTMAIVRFEDGNTLLIRKDSSITLEVYESKQQGQIKVEGLIHGLIDNTYEGNASSRFEFVSPSGIAGVRGSLVTFQNINNVCSFYVQRATTPAYIQQGFGLPLMNVRQGDVGMLVRVEIGMTPEGPRVVIFDPGLHSALELPPDTASVMTQIATGLPFNPDVEIIVNPLPPMMRQAPGDPTGGPPMQLMPLIKPGGSLLGELRLPKAGEFRIDSKLPAPRERIQEQNRDLIRQVETRTRQQIQQLQSTRSKVKVTLGF